MSLRLTTVAGWRLSAVAALLLLVAALAPTRTSAQEGACTAAHVRVRAATVSQAVDATLCLLNRARNRAGLPPLRLNAKLAAVSDDHSRDMARRRYFSHDSPNGATPFDRILATHYVPHDARSWWLGENIAWGSSSRAQPAAIVRAWMDSPPHRANILSSHFREIGIGIAPGTPSRAAGSDGATYTTDFGSHK